MNKYRVWPDGTVQDFSEAPYDWMSDDYIIVDAYDEDDALFESIDHKLWT